MQTKRFSINDILNNSVKQNDSEYQSYEEIYLSPYEVLESDGNFYSQEQIEELADSFLIVGQQQPTVLAFVDGKYIIVSGHRRNKANIFNIERKQMRKDIKIRYLYREMSKTMLDLSLLVGNAFTRKLTAFEEIAQAKALKNALIKARDEDGLPIEGKIRDLVAELLDTSPTQIARMNKIDNDLIETGKEELKKENIGLSAAYELSKFSDDEQVQVIEESKKNSKSISEIIEDKKKQISTENALAETEVSESDTIEEDKEITNEEFFFSLRGERLANFIYMNSQKLTSLRKIKKWLSEPCDPDGWEADFEIWGM